MAESELTALARALLAGAPAPPPPLQLISVEARGVPNQERIYLKANQRVELRHYLLIAGLALNDGTAFPGNTMMWLGNSTIEAGGWVIVYTGKGSPIVTKMQKTNEPTLVMYWGLDTTAFNAALMVPILVHVDKIQFPPSPKG